MISRRYTLSGAGAGLVMAALLTGCSHWDPVAVEEDFGNSVHHMIQAQTYDPEAARNPPADPPTELDGQKASEVLKAYRKDVAKPEEVEDAININIRSR